MYLAKILLQNWCSEQLKIDFVVYMCRDLRTSDLLYVTIFLTFGNYFLVNAAIIFVCSVWPISSLITTHFKE